MELIQKLSVVMLIVVSGTILHAHPGRTDANGGHYDRKTGQYHYHNSGSKSRSTSNSTSYSGNRHESSNTMDNYTESYDAKLINKLQSEIVKLKVEIANLNTKIVQLENENAKLTDLCNIAGIPVHDEEPQSIIAEQLTVKENPELINTEFYGIFLGERIENLEKRFEVIKKEPCNHAEASYTLILKPSDMSLQASDVTICRGYVTKITATTKDNSYEVYQTLKESFRKNYYLKQTDNLTDIFEIEIDGKNIQIELTREYPRATKITYSHIKLIDKLGDK